MPGLEVLQSCSSTAWGMSLGGGWPGIETGTSCCFLLAGSICPRHLLMAEACAACTAPSLTHQPVPGSRCIRAQSVAAAVLCKANCGGKGLTSLPGL